MEKSNLESLVMSPEYQEFVFNEIKKKHPGVKSQLILAITVLMMTSIAPLGIPLDEEFSKALRAVADICDMIHMASVNEKKGMD